MHAQHNEELAHFVEVRIGESTFSPPVLCVAHSPDRPLPHAPLLLVLWGVSFSFLFGRTGVRFGTPKIQILTSPPLCLTVQALLDRMQHILWVFNRTLPELVDTNMDRFITCLEAPRSA